MNGKANSLALMIEPCNVRFLMRPIGDICEACDHALVAHVLQGERMGICSVCEVVAEIRETTP